MKFEKISRRRFIAAGASGAAVGGILALPGTGRASVPGELADRLTPRLSPLPVPVGKSDQPVPVEFGWQLIAPTPDWALVRPVNGAWRFHPNPPAGFENTDGAGPGWADIKVPGEWAMQGFEVGLGQAAGYLKTFDLPADWAGRRIKLRFDAVYSECEVWLNGARVGSHTGGFTAFELDVTAAARPGAANTLALAVRNESAADTLAMGSMYAAHPLGGIIRGVSVFALPPVNLARLHADARPSGAGGAIDIDAVVVNEGAAEAPAGSIDFTLTGADGALPLTPASAPVPALPPGQRWRGRVRLATPAVQSWNPERPTLYDLRATLVTGGAAAYDVERRIGFRSIEVTKTELHINGRAVKLRGVCRHEAHPRLGRAITGEMRRRDAKLFQMANCNYVRTSHYPPGEEFVAACDELGILVEEEAPICWNHGAPMMTLTVRQTLEMIERDRSHPSVFCWSLANESQWMPSFAASSELAAAIDPSRPQTFEWTKYRKPGDDVLACAIASDHYPHNGQPARHRGRLNPRPVNYGEYCHLNCYNRAEIQTDPGLRDAWGPVFAKMWEEMYAAPGVLGGALWSGIDDTFFVPDKERKEGYRIVGYGPWGLIDGWRREKPEHFHVRKAYSPVRVLTKKLAPGPGPVTIEVENRHDFLDLSELKVEWQLGEGACCWGPYPNVISGKATAKIPPRGKGSFIIEVAELKDIQRLRLMFIRPDGLVVAEELLQIGEPPQQPPLEPGRPLAFNAVTGEVPGALAGWPTLMLLPLNPGGDTQMKGKPLEWEPYNPTCSGWSVKPGPAESTADGTRVTVTATSDEADGEISFLTDPSGIQVSCHFTVKKAVNPRQVGLVFTLPRSFDYLQWLRDAEHSIYPAGHIGEPLGGAGWCEKIFSPVGPIEDSGSREWADDGSPMGSNGFRATRRNVRWYALWGDGMAAGVEVVSDGRHHCRAWIEGESVRLLVACYDNAGAERFFERHAKQGYRPLSPGDEIKDRFRLEFRL